MISASKCFTSDISLGIVSLKPKENPWNLCFQIYFLYMGLPDSSKLNILQICFSLGGCCNLFFCFMILGTLRPDLIESASALASGKADAIKTHHNDTDLVRELRKQVRLRNKSVTLVCRDHSGYGLSNEGHHYIVTFLIGWDHTKIDPSSVTHSHAVLFQHIEAWTKQLLFEDDILKCTFLNETHCDFIQISLKSVPDAPSDNKSALIQVVA